MKVLVVVDDYSVRTRLVFALDKHASHIQGVLLEHGFTVIPFSTPRPVLRSHKEALRAAHFLSELLKAYHRQTPVAMVIFNKWQGS